MRKLLFLVLALSAVFIIQAEFMLNPPLGALDLICIIGCLFIFKTKAKKIFDWFMKEENHE